MNVPDDLLYTEDDEWVRVTDGEATIGITDYAQDSLSDIVYLELPDVDDTFEQGVAFGVVESVKAAADLLMPVSGVVTAVNEELIDTPETINTEPYTTAWLVRISISDESQLTGLMDAAAYKKYLANRD